LLQSVIDWPPLPILTLSPMMVLHCVAVTEAEHEDELLEAQLACTLAELLLDSLELQLALPLALLL